MALFGIGKKKSDEEDEEEFDLEDEKEERRKDRKLTRKLKDLNPENKKKRKEPPKPWGKKERVIVLSTLLTTIISSAVLALSARDFNLPNLPKIGGRFSFGNPFGEDKIFLGNKKMAMDTRAEDIKRAFAKQVKSLSGTYSFYVIELNSGVAFGTLEDEKMEAASLIKLPVFIALYKEVENGNIDLETKYTLKNSDKRTGSGSLSTKPAGTIVSYRDMAKLMGKESDNTSFNILKNVLGEAKVETAMKEIGMTETSVANNTTTPKDIGILFQKLWEGVYINESSRDEILGYLTDTIYENWIPSGIPPEVTVAHKYGREVHVVNDAGIIQSENPFVLVLMSQGVVEDQADKVFPVLARMIFEFEK